MKDDLCPRCGLGIVLESVPGWYCSRRYASVEPCTWEQGDTGPPPPKKKQGACL